jgi:Tol biopolymer transport system component
MALSDTTWEIIDMKNIFKLLCTLCVTAMVATSCVDKEAADGGFPAFGELNGPYLGQQPPGMTREVFAPGIISDGLFNGLIFFTEDGNEVIFSSGFEKPFYIGMLFHSRIEDGGWTEPVEIPLPRRKCFRPVLNPDGSRVYFISSDLEEPIEGKENLIKIYYIERTADGLSDPTVIDFGDDFPYSVSQASVASSGNLYFQAGYYIDGDEDIYVSRYENGEYLAPERLPDTINGEQHDLHPCVAPDESFLIFDSPKEGGFGMGDLYISFRDDNGEWTEAVNMGPKVNTESDERRSSLSFDGKYLFFESKLLGEIDLLPDPPLKLAELREFLVSHNNGGKDFYWVDAGVIDGLRPQ